MRIGILSDSHDNVENVRAAADVFTQQDVTTLLHCGDVCGPAVVEALAGFSVYFAQGNMDRLPALPLAIEALYGPGRLARCRQLLLGGFPVALLHGDDDGLLDQVVRSGEHAFVFHGHTHRRADRWVGKTRVLNPGALGGVRRESRSVCIVELQSGQARFIEIPAQVR